MAAWTLAEIRDALAATLIAAIPELSVYPSVQETPIVPAVFVMPESADFAVAMGRATDTYEVLLYVLAHKVHVGGQLDLDQLVSGYGPQSIRAAIFADQTLGLADVQALVRSMDDYGGTLEACGVPHVAAQLRVTIVCKGA